MKLFDRVFDWLESRPLYQIFVGVVLAFFLLVLLTGCGMTDNEVRAAKAECLDGGGKPIVMARLTGTVVEVRCW
jgi:hypothetical protein